MSLALKKTGRPMVLSLSPGPAPLEKAAEMAKYAQMWRIADDEWDVWQSSEAFPQGVNNQFERAAQWSSFSRMGNWPDADMLAVGRLEPAPGWGLPRTTRLTKDEQRTLMTLWVMMRSPLIMGGNLLLCDDWTKSLLTNPEVIAVNQHSRGNHPVETSAKSAVWVAQQETGGGYFVAVFNRSDAEQPLRYTLQESGLKNSGFALRDLWQHKELGKVSSIEVTLPAHGSALYAVRPQTD